MNKDSYPDYVNNKLAQWYWCGVLGELYGSAVNLVLQDLPELIDWISGKSRPKTIDDANFIPNSFNASLKAQCRLQGGVLTHNEKRLFRLAYRFRY